jgi:hypothetical protein
LIVDRADAIHVFQHILQKLFQVKGWDGASHNEDVVVEDEFKPGGATTKVGVRIEKCVRPLHDCLLLG